MLAMSLKIRSKQRFADRDRNISVWHGDDLANALCREKQVTKMMMIVNRHHHHYDNHHHYYGAYFCDDGDKTMPAG